MPILVQEVNDRMLAALDSENSDRYLFDQDIKPAINGANEVMVTMFNSAFASNKLTPECLRELSSVKIWQCNKYSRFSIDPADIGGEVWTITGIFPLPVTNKGAASGGSADLAKSVFRGDLSFVSSVNSCKRLTLEEWSTDMQNVFVPGNTILKGALAEYAYLDPNNYTSTSYSGAPNGVEWTIRPDVPNGLTGVGYVLYPKSISAIGDSLMFPQSLTALFVDCALSLIAYKIGDGTSIWSVATQYENRLVNLIKAK